MLAYGSESNVAITTTTTTAAAAAQESSLSAQGYLSVICCLLSDLGLLTRIGLQWVVPFFNSFPGRIQFCLCLSLALAYTFFLIGGLLKGDSQSCAALGAMTHVTFLSALFWMNVTAYEIWNTFRD
ncbi:hypothetical protein ACOMHN_036718 [Nucella lapillus]